MKININIYGEKTADTTTTTAAKNNSVRVIACELDNTINILFDGSNPICMADLTALNELEVMYQYDTTDTTLKKYINTLSAFLKD